MIRYALVCDQAHEFEGWFGDSAAFDAQAASGLLTCPTCDSATVRRQIMAPAVRRASAPSPAKTQAMMFEAMGKVRRHVEENFDYVGERFASEARQIHQGKAESRGIYGEASPPEVKELIADGVPVAPLPPKPPKKTEIQ